MTTDETSPSFSLFTIIKHSILAYLPVLRVIWPVIIFWVIIKNMIFYLDMWLTNVYVDETLWILLCFISLFTYTVLLHQTALALDQRQETLKNSVEVAGRIFPKVLLATLIIVFFLMATFLLPRWLISLSYDFSSSGLTLFIFLILGIVIFAEILYFFFVIPLIVIAGKKIGNAFITSGEFVGESMKLITFTYFAFMILCIFLAPYSLHALWLRQHFLIVPFDALVLAILLPCVLNIVFFSMRDLLLALEKDKELEQST